jgi:hypothetical protein
VKSSEVKSEVEGQNMSRGDHFVSNVDALDKHHMAGIKRPMSFRLGET